MKQIKVATVVIHDLLPELIYNSLFNLYYPFIKFSRLTKLFELGDFRDLASFIMNSTSS